MHNLHSTAANHSGVAHAHEALHGQERDVFLDARAYTGADKRQEVFEAQAEGSIHRDIRWNVAQRRSKRVQGTLKNLTTGLERVSIW